MRDELRPETFPNSRKRDREQYEIIDYASKFLPFPWDVPKVGRHSNMTHF